MFARSRQLRTTNIWPGFVDALAALLMVVIFVLLVFVISQFYLRETLIEQEGALDDIQSRVSELAELLSLEKASNVDLRDSVQQLSSELHVAIGKRESMQGELEAARLSLQEKTGLLAALQENFDQSQEEIAALNQQLADRNSQWEQAVFDVETERGLTRQQKDEIALLNRQILALRSQLDSISATLETVRQEDEANKVKIADLGRQLNTALAGKVQELSRYRSEFFGRLRDVLKDQQNIQIVGDRFVFQSEVFFASGSAELGPEGQKQLADLAKILEEIAPSIPDDIDWVLRIDGHTDRIPIASSRYPSNWELSTARALSVVDYLIRQGIPAKRLAAAGFGEHSPLSAGTNEEDNKRNRRIEIKLTQR